MKNQNVAFAMSLLMIIMLTGCAVVGGIFKTGMGVGVLIVVVIIVVVLLIASRSGKK